MTSVDDLVTVAARSLTSRFGFEVELVDVTALESQSTVLRARVAPPGSDSPNSVIVKHVSNVEFDPPDHTGPPSRFLTEWATLEFLTGLGTSVAPSLITASKDAGLFVLEDLGNHSNLETLLFGDDAAAARRGLGDMGRLLGELHAAGRGREAEFLCCQSRLGTRSPRSDSTIDQRERRNVFFAALETMGVGYGDRFWAEVVEMEALIHDDSPFRSLIHADAGPHNVLVADAVSRLIDFEFAVFRNSLCDLVGARVGFPQTMATGHVPREVVEALETAYREAVSLAIPEVADTRLFHRHLTAAAGHWALNRWASAWWIRRAPIGPGERPPDEAVKAMRSVLVVLNGFIASAREFGEFEFVAEALEQFAHVASTRWPGLEPSPVYPALEFGISDAVARLRGT